MGGMCKYVKDGLDVEAIDQAIRAAKLDLRPSIIMVQNIIVYGLPTRQGTANATGSRQGRGLNAAKDRLVGRKSRASMFRRVAGILPPGGGSRASWRWPGEDACCLSCGIPGLGDELERRLLESFPRGWERALRCSLPIQRDCDARLFWGSLECHLDSLPDVMGGSADLAPSTAPG
jgi:transketolase